MRYFTNVHDLGDLKSALAEAFEIKKDRYKYETLGKHKTCLLIFFNNSLRTRLSTQCESRCMEAGNRARCHYGWR
jgi:N-succinyl-L-ornithine transcarbamylase